MSHSTHAYEEIQYNYGKRPPSEMPRSNSKVPRESLGEPRYSLEAPVSPSNIPRSSSRIPGSPHDIPGSKFSSGSHPGYRARVSDEFERRAGVECNFDEYGNLRVSKLEGDITSDLCPPDMKALARASKKSTDKKGTYYNVGKDSPEAYSKIAYDQPKEKTKLSRGTYNQKSQVHSGYATSQKSNKTLYDQKLPIRSDYEARQRSQSNKNSYGKNYPDYSPGGSSKQYRNEYDQRYCPIEREEIKSCSCKEEQHEENCPLYAEPAKTCPHHVEPAQTCPHQVEPDQTCPHQVEPVQTCPHHNEPTTCCPHHRFPNECPGLRPAPIPPMPLPPLYDETEIQEGEDDEACIPTYGITSSLPPKDHAGFLQLCRTAKAVVRDSQYRAVKETLPETDPLSYHYHPLNYHMIRSRNLYELRHGDYCEDEYSYEDEAGCHSEPVTSPCFAERIKPFKPPFYDHYLFKEYFPSPCTLRERLCPPSDCPPPEEPPPPPPCPPPRTCPQPPDEPILVTRHNYICSELGESDINSQEKKLRKSRRTSNIEEEKRKKQCTRFEENVQNFQESDWQSSGQNRQAGGQNRQTGWQNEQAGWQNRQSGWQNRQIERQSRRTRETKGRTSRSDQKRKLEKSIKTERKISLTSVYMPRRTDCPRMPKTPKKDKKSVKSQKTKKCDLENDRFIEKDLEAECVEEEIWISRPIKELTPQCAETEYDDVCAENERWPSHSPSTRKSVKYSGLPSGSRKDQTSRFEESGKWTSRGAGSIKEENEEFEVNERTTYRRPSSRKEQSVRYVEDERPTYRKSGSRKEQSVRYVEDERPTYRRPSSRKETSEDQTCGCRNSNKTKESIRTQNDRTSGYKEMSRELNAGCDCNAKKEPWQNEHNGINRNTNRPMTTCPV